MSRRVMTWMLLIAVLGFALPAVSAASGGGGSAGDQQYTDPFAGTTTPAKGSPSGSSSQTRTTAPAPTTSAPAPPPPASTTPAPAGAPAATSAAPAPAASATTGSSTSPRQLPFTGYDSWLAAAAGFAMVAGGVALQRRIRRI